MDSNVFQGEWQKLRGTIRSKWGKLTDDDLEQVAGNKDKLVGLVQERYGYMWDEAQRMVDRYLDEYDQGGFGSRISNVVSKENLQQLRDAVSTDNLQKLGNEIVDCVRRYPIASLLIGVGVGYLLARRPGYYDRD
jgi:uncharacterized protein YjbJ (UPF0337 family)